MDRIHARILEGQWFVAIKESVSSVFEDALKNHEWVTELTIFMQESEKLVALNYEFEVPCVVQW